MPKTVEYWKSPEKRMDMESMSNPAGDLFEELSDSEMDKVTGGCAWYNVSCHLGNDGYVCTLTVECQPNCN